MSDGRIEINTRINDRGINAGLAKIKAKLNSLETATYLLSKRMNNSLSKGFSDLHMQAGGLNSLLLLTSKIAAGIALGSTLSPALAASTAGVLALSSSLSVAAIGAAGFGAVAVGAMTNLFESAEEVAAIEAKIANAESYEDKIEAQKELKALYDDMSESQRYALEELKNFKSFWSDFVKEFESPVFDSFGLTLNIVKNILEGMKPAIENVADVIVEMLESVDQSIANGGMKDFFEWLEVNAAESLRNFSKIGGDLLIGFFELLQAFSPLGASMEEGLMDLTERFKEWASSLSESTAFQDFVSYARENGPILLETIGNLVDIIKNLGTELAPLGAEVLEGLRNFTNLIIDNWPIAKETVIGLTTAVVSYLAIMKALTIISTITALIKAWRAGTLAATIAQYGLNTAMLANPITWLVALIAGLIAIGVLLYRNWDTVKEKAGQLWNVISDKFSAIKDTIEDKVGAAKDFVKDQIDKIVGFFANMKISFPKIKLPHFSVKGSLDLFNIPPKIPSVSVDWYKNGGLFPANSPRLVGIGDASVPEAALPLKPSVLGMIGDRIAQTMNGTNNTRPIEILINNKTDLDGRELSRNIYKIVTDFQDSNNERIKIFEGRN